MPIPYTSVPITHHILSSHGARVLRQVIRDDGNGIEWLEFLREVGAEHLPDYLTDDGEPDMNRIRATLDRLRRNG